jgi:hypothetical protein
MSAREPPTIADPVEPKTPERNWPASTVPMFFALSDS